MAVLCGQAVVVAEQLLAGGSGELGVVDGLLDLDGASVGDLAGAAGLSCLLGDGTEASGEDGGGIADPGEDG
jgi:hypothetical protein